MQKKVTVGIFWVCDDGETLQLIYDTEQYNPDEYFSVLGDEFIMYEKNHRETWKELSAKFYDGKYAFAAFNDYPRGRVTYDSEDKIYLVDVDKALKAKFNEEVKPLLDKVFDLKKAEYHVDKLLKSKIGKYHP
jgi:hypothetical protein